MPIDEEQKTKIENYVNENEQNQGFGKIAETVAELTGVEKETKENFLNKWLKNDENLLSYAELSMKTEKLNIGESIKKKLLELKLSITCPYFADFKEFLQELKHGPDTSTTTETIPESSELSNHKFCGTKVNNIKSEPFQKNSRTGVTWCSRTARYNGLNFGITLPSGDAYKAGKLPGEKAIQTIPNNKINKTPQNSWTGIKIDIFKNINSGNFADIYTDSKSRYGHRAIAFKYDNGQWYVLDPYTRVNGKLDNTPKKLEDYLKVKKIVKAHIYESKGYDEKHDLIDERGNGYEWENS